MSSGLVLLAGPGKITSAQRATQVVEESCDFVLIRRAAILHADFPERVRRDPAYTSLTLPVMAEFLRDQGLSPPFINYMATAWDNFVARDVAA